MNKVILLGRLTRDPEVKYTTGQNPMAVAKFTLAVERPVKRDANSTEQTADFISCTAFGKQGEFAEKYLRKGVKIALEGRIQTGSYTNKENVKVYTTDVITERIEFAESKKDAENAPATNPYANFDVGSKEAGVSDTEDELPFM